jgi:hypothetical protein
MTNCDIKPVIFTTLSAEGSIELSYFAKSVIWEKILLYADIAAENDKKKNSAIQLDKS